MARQYARLKCSTWADDDFLALSVNARMLFFALMSQHDISPCGVLILAERRWRRFLDGTITSVETAINELSDRRYAMVDLEAAELWIRSFIKNDGRLANDKMLKSILASFDSVRSDAIKGAIQREYPDIFPGGSPNDRRSIPDPENDEGGSMGDPIAVPYPHPQPQPQQASSSAYSSTQDSYARDQWANVLKFTIGTVDEAAS